VLPLLIDHHHSFSARVGLDCESLLLNGSRESVRTVALGVHGVRRQAFLHVSGLQQVAVPTLGQHPQHVSRHSDSVYNHCSGLMALN